jgi:isocitrate dehydrogenase
LAEAERMAGVEIAPVSSEERQRMMREALETGRHGKPGLWKGKTSH